MALRHPWHYSSINPPGRYPIRLTIALLWFSVGFLFVLLFTLPVYPHGGGLDAYGCHHNRKQGGYHCHRGEFAGLSFTSQEEMLQKLKAQRQALGQPLPGEETKQQAKPSTPVQKPQTSVTQTQEQTKPGQKAIGTTATGKTIYEGPRGGRYHYSKSGKKVYEQRKK